MACSRARLLPSARYTSSRAIPARMRWPTRKPSVLPWTGFVAKSVAPDSNACRIDSTSSRLVIMRIGVRPPAGERTDGGAGREAVHPGHHGVHQDQGRPQALEGLHALPAVPGLLHVEPGLLEGLPGDEAGNLVVVHEEDERAPLRAGGTVDHDDSW